MTSISTKTGDKGKSGLINGQRLDKDDLVFEAIGTIDELNSFIGLAISRFEENFPQSKKFLFKVQDTLFYLGAELAGSSETKLASRHLKLLEKRASQLEQKLSSKWHNKFLLPGGTDLAASLDVARSVCRRSERSLVAFSRKNKLRPLVLKYLNRFSDYLYLLRTYVNASSEYQEQEFEAD